MHLLHPAGFVQFHDLGKLRVFKVRHCGIIEGDMPVLPHAQHADIQRMALQQLAVALCLLLRVLRVAVDQVHALKVLFAEYRLHEEVAEARRMILAQADILVHMKTVDALPLDIRVGHQRAQRLILGRGRGKHHVDFFLLFQQLLQLRSRLAARALAHGVARVKHPVTEQAANGI